MDNRLSPRMSLWSKEMGVIAVILGFTTFVESSLPPRPTSITAKSTFSFAKCVNAIAVVVSKNVDDISSISFLCSSTNNSISSSDIHLPSIVILSLNLIRCGDV